MSIPPCALRVFLLLAPGLALTADSWAVGEGAPRAGAARARPASILYRQYCAQCHGDDHKGGELRERGQYIPDFTRADWHARHDDTQLLVSILDGKGTRMPPFHDQLTEAEARALVTHLREFAPVKKQPPADGPDDFARRFAELEKEFEELRKQFHELSRQARQP